MNLIPLCTEESIFSLWMIQFGQDINLSFKNSIGVRLMLHAAMVINVQPAWSDAETQTLPGCCKPRSCVYKWYFARIPRWSHFTRLCFRKPAPCLMSRSEKGPDEQRVLLTVLWSASQIAASYVIDFINSRHGSRSWNGERGQQKEKNPSKGLKRACKWR